MRTILGLSSGTLMAVLILCVGLLSPPQETTSNPVKLGGWFGPNSGAPQLAQPETAPVATATSAPQETLPGEFVEARRGSFHAGVLRAIRAKVRSGELTRAEGVRLRVSMLSPDFRKHAYNLAITQIKSSGAQGAPLTPSGELDEAAIDWDGLTAFLEALVQFIQQLQDILGPILQPE